MLLFQSVFRLFCRYYQAGSHCEKCHHSCEMCTGPGPGSCRACLPPLLELQGTKLCVERCPQRFYRLDDVCLQCHISCHTCIGDYQAKAVDLSSLFPFLRVNIGHNFSQQMSCVLGRRLPSELCDLWQRQHAKGQSLLPTLWGGEVLHWKGVLTIQYCIDTSSFMVLHTNHMLFGVCLPITVVTWCTS